MIKYVVVLLTVFFAGPASAQDFFQQKMDELYTRMKLDFRRSSDCRDHPEVCSLPAHMFNEFVYQTISMGGGGFNMKTITLANTGVNTIIDEATDMEQYGKEDYWASPLETMSTLKGDCEDIVMLKYMALLALQVSYKNMRIGIVHNKKDKPNKFHMILLVSFQNELYVLDNLRKDVVPLDKTRYHIEELLDFKDS